MHALELQPLDTLFFRDARPMTAGAGSGGHGANWPLPTVVHEALRASLLRLAGEMHSGKDRRGHAGKAIVTEAFRSLHTRGPFPLRGRTLHLPCPADLVETGDGRTTRWELMAPAPDDQGNSDLPSPLRPVFAAGRPGKERPPTWIPLDEFVMTLDGRAPKVIEFEPLFQSEHRVGIGIDSATGSAADGMLYSAEHLRLAPGVSLWMAAELSDVKATENRARKLEELHGGSLQLGGEGRVVRVSPSDVALHIAKPKAHRLIKWVLTTHAVFVGGWRPNWIEEQTGRVLLVGGDTTRRPGESRETWRLRVRALSSIDARLVALRNEKPVHFSGWDLAEGAKPTLTAVPAGSVYYFEAASEAEGARLIDALHGRTRSDFLGEKGMGLGFCGTWEPADVAGRPQSGNIQSNK